MGGSNLDWWVGNILLGLGFFTAGILVLAALGFVGYAVIEALS